MFSCVSETLSVQENINLESLDRWLEMTFLVFTLVESLGDTMHVLRNTIHFICFPIDRGNTLNVSLYFGRATRPRRGDLPSPPAPPPRPPPPSLPSPPVGYLVCSRVRCSIRNRNAVPPFGGTTVPGTAAWGRACGGRGQPREGRWRLRGGRGRPREERGRPRGGKAAAAGGKGAAARGKGAPVRGGEAAAQGEEERGKCLCPCAPKHVFARFFKIVRQMLC